MSKRKREQSDVDDNNNKLFKTKCTWISSYSYRFKRDDGVTTFACSEKFGSKETPETLYSSAVEGWTIPLSESESKRFMNSIRVNHRAISVDAFNSYISDEQPEEVFIR